MSSGKSVVCFHSLGSAEHWRALGTRTINDVKLPQSRLSISNGEVLVHFQLSSCLASLVLTITVVVVHLISRLDKEREII